MSWQWRTSMDRGQCGHHGPSVVDCVVVELEVDTACVTHRPQVAPAASVTAIRISCLTVTLTPVRCSSLPVSLSLSSSLSLSLCVYLCVYLSPLLFEVLTMLLNEILNSIGIQ